MEIKKLTTSSPEADLGLIKQLISEKIQQKMNNLRLTDEESFDQYFYSSDQISQQRFDLKDIKWSTLEDIIYYKHKLALVLAGEKDVNVSITLEHIRGGGHETANSLHHMIAAYSQEVIKRLKDKHDYLDNEDLQGLRAYKKNKLNDAEDDGDSEYEELQDCVAIIEAVINLEEAIEYFKRPVVGVVLVPQVLVKIPSSEIDRGKEEDKEQGYQNPEIPIAIDKQEDSEEESISDQWHEREPQIIELTREQKEQRLWELQNMIIPNLFEELDFENFEEADKRKKFLERELFFNSENFEERQNYDFQIQKLENLSKFDLEARTLETDLGIEHKIYSDDESRKTQPDPIDKEKEKKILVELIQQGIRLEYFEEEDSNIETIQKDVETLNKRLQKTDLSPDNKTIFQEKRDFLQLIINQHQKMQSEVEIDLPGSLIDNPQNEDNLIQQKRPFKMMQFYEMSNFPKNSFEYLITKVIYYCFVKVEDPENQIITIDIPDIQSFLKATIDQIVSILNEENQNNPELQRMLENLKYSCQSENYQIAVDLAEKIYFQYVHFNFCEFQNLLFLAKQSSQQIKGLDVILLLGSTGCGKSTTIQYLCGSKMRQIHVNGLTHIEAFKIINKDLIKVRLSPFTKSETRYITPIEINLKDLGASNSQTIVLVDTPGSQDTESKEVDISNGVGIIKAVSLAKSVKPIILISWRTVGPRLDGIKAILSYYSRMAKGEKRDLAKFIFLFTHCPNDVDENEIRSRLEDLKKCLNPKELVNEAMVNFIDVLILQAKQGKIKILRPLDNNPLAIHQLIQQSESIKNPSQFFKRAIQDNSFRQVNNQIIKNKEIIKEALIRGNSKIAIQRMNDLARFAAVFRKEGTYTKDIIDIFRECQKYLNNELQKEANKLISCLNFGNSLKKDQVLNYKQVCDKVKRLQPFLDLFNQRAKNKTFENDFLCSCIKDEKDLKIVTSYDYKQIIIKHCSSMLKQFERVDIEDDYWAEFQYKADLLLNFPCQDLSKVFSEVKEIYSQKIQQFQQTTVELFRQLDLQDFKKMMSDEDLDKLDQDLKENLCKELPVEIQISQQFDKILKAIINTSDLVTKEQLLNVQSEILFKLDNQMTQDYDKYINKFIEAINLENLSTIDLNKVFIDNANQFLNMVQTLCKLLQRCLDKQNNLSSTLNFSQLQNIGELVNKNLFELYDSLENCFEKATVQRQEARVIKNIDEQIKKFLRIQAINSKIGSKYKQKKMIIQQDLNRQKIEIQKILQRINSNIQSRQPIIEQDIEDLENCVSTLESFKGLVEGTEQFFNGIKVQLTRIISYSYNIFKNEFEDISFSVIENINIKVQDLNKIDVKFTQSSKIYNIAKLLCLNIDEFDKNQFWIHQIQESLDTIQLFLDQNIRLLEESKEEFPILKRSDIKQLNQMFEYLFILNEKRNFLDKLDQILKTQVANLFEQMKKCLKNYKNIINQNFENQIINITNKFQNLQFQTPSDSESIKLEQQIDEISNQIGKSVKIIDGTTKLFTEIINEKYKLINEHFDCNPSNIEHLKQFIHNLHITIEKRFDTLIRENKFMKIQTFLQLTKELYILDNSIQLCDPQNKSKIFNKLHDKITNQRVNEIDDAQLRLAITELENNNFENLAAIMIELQNYKNQKLVEVQKDLDNQILKLSKNLQSRLNQLEREENEKPFFSSFNQDLIFLNKIKKNLDKFISKTSKTKIQQNFDLINDFINKAFAKESNLIQSAIMDNKFSIAFNLIKTNLQNQLYWLKEEKIFENYVPSEQGNYSLETLISELDKKSQNLFQNIKDYPNILQFSDFKQCSSSSVKRINEDLEQLHSTCQDLNLQNIIVNSLKEAQQSIYKSFKAQIQQIEFEVNNASESTIYSLQSLKESLAVQNFSRIAQNLDSEIETLIIKAKDVIFRRQMEISTNALEKLEDIQSTAQDIIEISKAILENKIAKTEKLTQTINQKIQTMYLQLKQYIGDINIGKDCIEQIFLVSKKIISFNHFKKFEFFEKKNQELIQEVEKIICGLYHECFTFIIEILEMKQDQQIQSSKNRLIRKEYFSKTFQQLINFYIYNPSIFAQFDEKIEQLIISISNQITDVQNIKKKLIEYNILHHEFEKIQFLQVYEEYFFQAFQSKQFIEYLGNVQNRDDIIRQLTKIKQSPDLNTVINEVIKKLSQSQTIMQFWYDHREITSFYGDDVKFKQLMIDLKQNFELTKQLQNNKKNKFLQSKINILIFAESANNLQIQINKQINDFQNEIQDIIKNNNSFQNQSQINQLISNLKVIQFLESEYLIKQKSYENFVIQLKNKLVLINEQINFQYKKEKKPDDFANFLMITYSIENLKLDYKSNFHDNPKKVYDKLINNIKMFQNTENSILIAQIFKILSNSDVGAQIIQDNEELFNKQHMQEFQLQTLDKQTILKGILTQNFGGSVQNLDQEEKQKLDQFMKKIIEKFKHQTDEYKSLLELKLVETIDGLAGQIIQNFEKLQMKGQLSQFDIEQELPELIGLIFALLSLQDYKSNKSIQLFVPNPAQIFALLRLLSLGFSSSPRDTQENKQIFNKNLVEMRPGEGKSTLSLVASCIFALLGYEVFLIKEDYVYANKAQFDADSLLNILNIKGKVNFSTIQRACHLIIEKQFLLETVNQQILRNYKGNPIVQNQQKNYVLIFDEIDQVQDPENFGANEEILLKIKDQKTKQFFKYLWETYQHANDDKNIFEKAYQWGKKKLVGVNEEEKTSILTNKLNEKKEYKELKQVMKGTYQEVVDLCSQQIIQELIFYQNASSDQKGSRFITDNLRYQKIWEQYSNSPQTRQQKTQYQDEIETELIIKLGTLAYYQFIQQFLVVGFSSKIDLENQFELDIIKTALKIESFTIIPSGFTLEKSFVDTNSCKIVIVENKDKQLQLIFDNVQQYKKSNKGSPVIIVFKSKKKLQNYQERFKQQNYTIFSDNMASYQGLKSRRLRTDEIILMTKQHALQFNFVFRNNDIQKQSLVIQTFLTYSLSEMYRIRGRGHGQGNQCEFMVIGTKSVLVEKYKFEKESIKKINSASNIKEALEIIKNYLEIWRQPYNHKSINRFKKMNKFEEIQQIGLEIQSQGKGKLDPDHMQTLLRLLKKQKYVRKSLLDKNPNDHY